MADPHDIPLETTEGWRPGSSGGERILVALAAIALVSAVLIVAGNLLKRDDTASHASPTPRPSARPSPTTTPIPTPQEVVLVPQSSVPPQPAQFLFNGWIRPSVDLPISAAAIDGGATIGTLAAGSAAYADEQPGSAASDRGWLFVEGPGQQGYVATADGGAAPVRRYQARTTVWPGIISSVAAGPHGLVAIGSQSGRSDSPYPAPSVFASADGVTWHRSGLHSDLPCCVSAVAWGPAGWLLVGTSGSSDGVWIWSSQDGEEWRGLGVLPGGYPQSIGGSQRGYLLVTQGPGRGTGRQTWFSTDGSHWTQVDPVIRASGVLIAATDAGFYAWTDASCCGSEAAFSPDGRAWSPLSVFPDGLNLHVVALNGYLIAINTDAGTGTSHAWLGYIDGGTLSWRPMPQGAEPFGNAVVSAVVSDGRFVIALGWDRTSEAAMAWVSDDGLWTRSLLPADFGGIPTIAAGGAARTAVVGHAWNARGDNPVLWRWNGGGSWAPEDVPVVANVPSPSAPDCPSLPADGIAFVGLDRPEAVACFGDAPITMRMWSNPCDGCMGGQGGTYEQGWLAAPDRNVLSVSPVKWPERSWSNLVLDPSLGTQPDPGWSGTWLKLTGHFDDPRATACRWVPETNSLAYYYGARVTVESCRQQFVVTKVQVVTGP